MATYINGVTDYIPQIQSFQPDLNFYGNVMQARQGKFDAGRKKINDLYGSILYAPLTGEDNIKRRDDFFKTIDNDIKRISGMDLSLEQNQDAAAQVFQGFLEDKDIQTDMVWTKNWMNAEQKHNAMMNCFDPTKCGGQAWDDGIKDLQYKRDDFRKATNEERKNMEAPNYVPYYNWMKEAHAAAKEKGYTVSKDTITGDYIVTDTNGDLIQDGLYGVFKDAYGSDPRVEANYNVMGYVTRKDAARRDASLYGSEDAAERAYIGDIINKGAKSLTASIDKNNETLASTQARIDDLTSKQDKRALTKEEEQILANAIATRDNTKEVANFLETSLNSIKANAEEGDMRTLRRRADASTAQLKLKADLDSVAWSIAETSKTQKIRENDFAKIKKNLQASISLAGYNSMLNREEMSLQHGYNITEKMLEMGLKQGIVPPEESHYEIKEGSPGATYSLNTLDHPEAGYVHEKEIGEAEQAEAKAGSTSVLFNLFQKAKNSPNSPGAKQYLAKIYGDKAADIDTPEKFNEFIRTKNANLLFNESIKHFKGKTGDIGWGEMILKQHATDIAHVQNAQIAATETVNFNLKNNKALADQMKSEASTNPLYKYLDEIFIKTNGGTSKAGGKSSGFLIMDKKVPMQFVEKYISDNPNADYDDAQDAFTTLQSDYYTRYNSKNNKNLNITTGDYLTGTGGVSANSFVRSMVDPAEKSPNSVNQHVLNTLDKALSNGAYVAGIGGNTKDVYNNAVKNTELSDWTSSVLRTFLTEARSSTFKGDKARPIYHVEANTIAGESKETAGLTLKIDPTYIYANTGEGKLFTKESAQAVLTNGITMFYNKKEIPSAFTQMSKDTDFQRIMKLKGEHVTDTYAETAGIINATMDKFTNKVSFSVQRKYVDKNGDLAWAAEERLLPIGIAEAGVQYDKILTQLQAGQSSNLELLDKYALLKKQNKK